MEFLKSPRYSILVIEATLGSKPSGVWKFTLKSVAALDVLPKAAVTAVAPAPEDCLKIRRLNYLI